MRLNGVGKVESLSIDVTVRYILNCSVHTNIRKNMTQTHYIMYALYFSRNIIIFQVDGLCNFVLPKVTRILRTVIITNLNFQRNLFKIFSRCEDFSSFQTARSKSVRAYATRVMHTFKDGNVKSLFLPQPQLSTHYEI